MYNRYIRNDQGTYTRVSEEEPHRQQQAQGRPREHAQSTPRPAKPAPNEGPSFASESGLTDGISRTLRHLLDRFHLENVDTGDLLLLLLLFLLFEEDADEELLIALGLLLIL